MELEALGLVKAVYVVHVDAHAWGVNYIVGCCNATEHGRYGLSCM